MVHEKIKEEDKALRFEYRAREVPKSVKEKKFDGSGKFTLATEKSKHEGKKYDSKNPVDSKTKKLDKRSGLEGRPMEDGKSARSKCKDGLDGRKVMECKPEIKEEEAGFKTPEALSAKMP